MTAESEALASDIERLVARDHPQPHDVLGAHPVGSGVIVRAYRPDATAVRVMPLRGNAVDLERRHPAGVFEGRLPRRQLPFRYRLEVEYGGGSTVTLDDPYAFLPTLGELDLYLAGEGRHEELYARLGAHVQEIDGVAGTSFSVWAPAARSVSVVGDFNGWDGRLNPMRTLGSAGIWELFLPGVGNGARYKYEVRTQDGSLLLKADPVAFAAETPPATASVVHQSRHVWHDDAWLDRRRAAPQLDRPISIYEVHLGSWRRNSLEGNRSLTYLELAEELGAYAVDLGFSHVELMPVMEHPFSGSWVTR